MKWRAHKAVTWARKAIIASSLSIAATLIIYIYSPSLLLPLIMADILSVILLAHWTSNCSCWVVWLLDFPGVGLIEERSKTQAHTVIPKLT